MNRSIFLYLFILGILTFSRVSYGQDTKQAYSIHLQTKNVNAGEKVFLQIYQGKSLINIDSLAITKNQIAFQGNKPLNPGMYALSLNKTLLSNFFISNKNDQNFTISLDVQNPAQTLTFTRSPENQAFVDYLRFLGTKQPSQADIKLKGEQLKKQFPNSMLALFIKTMLEPEIPEPAKPVANILEYSYRYMFNHYFDNINFSDKRLLNTPLLVQKLGFYFKQMVLPLPDSINDRVEWVLDKARANSEVYNWTVRYLYNLYREAPIEGNTEVYNYIGENYIISEPTRWNDKTFVEKVRNRVDKTKLNPIGEKATNLMLQSPDGKKVDLYNIKANYTILFFYNPECEACKPVSVALSDFSKQYRSKGVEVFAVYMDQKHDVWKAAIATKGQAWINIFDPNGSAKIEEKYDLYALPMIYLLDKDKKVVAKDVSVEKLKNLLK